MYYPKSQIKTGLHTNGNEFVYQDTGEDYLGPYWTTAALDIFSGTSPTDPTSSRLVRKPVTINASTQALAQQQPDTRDTQMPISFTINRTYASLKNLPIDPTKQPKAPTSAIIFPTETDYKTGQFERFFCKKNNEVMYLEINQATYTKFSGSSPEVLWQLYTPFSLMWVLTGDKETVYRTNKKIVEYMVKKYNLSNLAEFLKNDYLKYYKG